MKQLDIHIPDEVAQRAATILRNYCKETGCAYCTFKYTDERDGMWACRLNHTRPSEYEIVDRKEGEIDGNEKTGTKTDRRRRVKKGVVEEEPGVGSSWGGI